MLYEEGLLYDVILLYLTVVQLSE